MFNGLKFENEEMLECLTNMDFSSLDSAELEDFRACFKEKHPEASARSASAKSVLKENGSSINLIQISLQ